MSENLEDTIKRWKVRDAGILRAAEEAQVQADREAEEFHKLYSTMLMMIYLPRGIYLQLAALAAAVVLATVALLTS
jgi:hypothetical protein